ncbi:hypothetical protein PCANC_22914 [Puccinia coronata f. sp. avenae]|uniref:Uncharacterized protein n=1 Tax=Puccinia coronata f. sp. avenae TaxID=200324 RepID=A0A2N5TLH1_9BASI|nr:hypothetical protein PCANC_22914 [Puccinia coronata f. sp. avenae]
MKIALLQAVSTQEILKNLVGFNAMMSISEYWNARDELTRLDAFIKAQEDAALSQMTTNPDVQIQASTRPPPLQQQLERLSSGPPQGSSHQSPVYRRRRHNMLFSRWPNPTVWDTLLVTAVILTTQVDPLPVTAA